MWSQLHSTPLKELLRPTGCCHNVNLRESVIGFLFASYCRDRDRNYANKATQVVLGGLWFFVFLISTVSSWREVIVSQHESNKRISIQMRSWRRAATFNILRSDESVDRSTVDEILSLEREKDGGRYYCVITPWPENPIFHAISPNFIHFL